MNVYFNPLDKACKSITGGVRQGDKLQFNLFYLKENFTQGEFFSLRTPLWGECETPAPEATLSLGKDGEERSLYPLRKTSYGWTISLKINEIGLYYYNFVIDDFYLTMGKGRFGQLSGEKKPEFQLLVFAEDYTTPDWFKGGILYQIFPDRFCKVGNMPDIAGRIPRFDWGGTPSYKPDEKGKILNNDFFGGNFKGIQSKLKYLKSLSVSAIYLNPIFEAASNHRYDTSDYRNVDPILGTKEDFQNLVEEAKKYGIRLILDGVFNHTGDNSVYFNKYGRYPSIGAYQSKNSPYYSWYTFQEYPDKYNSWWGIDILPEVNEESESYQEFILGENGVLKHWLSYGIGGYRLDVADELPDFFLKKLRTTVKTANPEAVIIGEVWEDASNKIAYSKRREYLQGGELDSVMNYPLKDAIIHFIVTGNAENLVDTMRMLCDNYPKQTLDALMNILGTHDTARILTVLGGKSCYTKDEMASVQMRLTEKEKKLAIEKVKMAALLQYTLPGVPCVYYGDENAAEGYIDPFCRGCFDWEHLNGELISYYQTLGKIRTRFREIFCSGEYEEIYQRNGCFIFRRLNSNTEIYIYVNNSSEGYFINFSGNYLEQLQNIAFENIFEIKPDSFGIFSKAEI